MKRKLALIVLVAILATMCVVAFAACGDKLDDVSLSLLKIEAEKELAKATGRSYTLSTTVKTTNVKDEEISCNVSWTADNGVVIGAESNGVVSVAVPETVTTTYKLTGTLVNKDKEAYKMADGTVVAVEKEITVGGSNPNPNPNPNPTPDPDGTITASQAKTEAEALNLTNGTYSEKSYKILAYAVKVSTKTLSGGDTVYDIDLADTANGAKAFTLYHGNLSGTDVPAVGDKVLVEGHFTRYDYKDGTFVLQVGGNTTVGYPTVKVVEKGQGGGTDPNPNPNPNPGGENLNGEINGVIPTGWTYYNVDTSHMTPDFYKDGGLKIRFEGIGIVSPAFTAATGNISVAITINALNPNTKSTTQTHVFTVEALNASGEVIATSYLDAVSTGENNVTITGAVGAVQIRVVMTGYPNIDGTCQNVSFGGVAIIK